MKRITTFALFEASAPAQVSMETIKKRLTDEVSLNISPDGLPDAASDTLRWLRNEYKIDLSPLIKTLRDFIIKSACDQIPNILHGVKGDEYAKYLDFNIKAILKDFAAKQFAAVPGKRKLLKTAYLRSGQQGLAKDILNKYKTHRLSEGEKSLIDAMIYKISSLSVTISQGIRLDHTFGEQYPDIAPYADAIFKWQDEYDSYFNDDNKTLVAYLDSVTQGIWS